MLCRYEGCQNKAERQVVVHRVHGKSASTPMCQEHLDNLQVYAVTCDLPVTFEVIPLPPDLSLWEQAFPSIQHINWSNRDEVMATAEYIATNYDVFAWKKFGLFARYYGYLQDRPTPAQFLKQVQI